MNSCSISSYTRTPRSNAQVVTMGGITVYFSYSTPVAFVTPQGELVIRQNDWSATSGRHLNIIDPDHSKRITGEAFRARLSALLPE